MKTRTTPLIATLVAAALIAGACGTSSAAEDLTPDMSDSITMDRTGPMNMGNVDATPAREVRGAELASGSFVLLATAPTGYEEVSGTADLARHEGGTTVSIELSGLPSDTEFISHVHAGTCSEDGGPHFMFEPDGAAMPPNEIHLAFTSNADGIGFMTAENDNTVGPEASSVVVHPVRSTSAKVACADLARQG